MGMKDSREFILKTAFSLFITKGYKALTMQDLENATKLTKGAFYYYFRSKEDLFKAVIEKYYLPSVLICQADEVESLEHYINLNVTCIREKMLILKELTGGNMPDPHYLTLILEAKKYFPSLEAKIKSTFRSQINYWEKIIVKAKESGEIKNNIESSTLAEIFTAIGLGIIKNLILDDSLEYSISKIKLQYEQLYRLMKN
jgi:AcrR family transcriptional regulator